MGHLEIRLTAGIFKFCHHGGQALWGWFLHRSRVIIILISIKYGICLVLSNIFCLLAKTLLGRQ
jgi:hypothetical protein